jgi:hypothetical protein
MEAMISLLKAVVLGETTKPMKILFGTDGFQTGFQACTSEF